MQRGRLHEHYGKVSAISVNPIPIYNVHADHIATPHIITKQNHTIVWRWKLK